jgi:hypothetical protein
MELTPYPVINVPKKTIEISGQMEVNQITVAFREK